MCGGASAKLGDRKSKLHRPRVSVPSLHLPSSVIALTVVVGGHNGNPLTENVDTLKQDTSVHIHSSKRRL